MRRFVVAAFVALALLPAASVGQQSPITWSPARPRPGTLFRLSVVADDSATLMGSVAGEPLHFRPTGDGRTFEALAAVPIDSTRRVSATVIVEQGGLRALDVVPIPVSAGAYPTERLSVAPRFGAAPDSALQRRIDDEARRAAEVSRAAHATPRIWRGAWARPRPGAVTSGFGRARVFNGAVASRHMGTDFRGAVGDPVRAVNRGVVRLTGSFYYGGNVVYVDHGEGLVTAYLHLSRAAVAVGDTVEAGQVIGSVGATGRVTGPHLHLIARYGNVTVDPETLLRVTDVRPQP